MDCSKDWAEIFLVFLLFFWRGRGDPTNPLKCSKNSGVPTLNKSKRKAMNRNWSNQKANPALNTKVGNK